MNELTCCSYCSFQPLQSLLPFFTCLSGDFTLACNSFFPLVNPPAALLTPELFNVYLRVFETATAPQLLVAQPSELCCTKATWEPIKGQVKCLLLVTFQSLGAGPLKYSLCVDAVPLKRAELVRFALRVQTCCPAVSADVSLQGLSIKSPAPSGRSFSLLAHQLFGVVFLPVFLLDPVTQRCQQTFLFNIINRSVASRPSLPPRRFLFH